MMRKNHVLAAMIVLSGLSCKKQETVSLPVAAPATQQTVTVYVSGRIKNPGVYSETGRKPLKLLAAIHKAGGGDGGSADYQVLVNRKLKNNLTQTITYSSLAAMESTVTDFDLATEDQIFLKDAGVQK